MDNQNNVNKNALPVVRLFVRNLGESMLLDYGAKPRTYTSYKNKLDYSNFTRDVIVRRSGWENVTNGFFEYQDQDVIEIFKDDTITEVTTKVGEMEFHQLIATIPNREERYFLMNLEEKEMTLFIEKVSAMKKWQLYLPPS